MFAQCLKGSLQNTVGPRQNGRFQFDLLSFHFFRQDHGVIHEPIQQIEEKRCIVLETFDAQAEAVSSRKTVHRRPAGFDGLAQGLRIEVRRGLGPDAGGQGRQSVVRLVFVTGAAVERDGHIHEGKRGVFFEQQRHAVGQNGLFDRRDTGGFLDLVLSQRRL